MAYQKNPTTSENRNNVFPVQRRLWDRIYEKSNLTETAKALGKPPEWLSRVLDGQYDLKWSTVKALCEYLEIENPMEVLL